MSIATKADTLALHVQNTAAFQDRKGFSPNVLPIASLRRWRPLRAWRRSWRHLAPWSQSRENCCAPFRPCSTSELHPPLFQRHCCARARSATHAGSSGTDLIRAVWLFISSEDGNVHLFKKKKKHFLKLHMLSTANECNCFVDTVEKYSLVLPTWLAISGLILESSHTGNPAVWTLETFNCCRVGPRHKHTRNLRSRRPPRVEGFSKKTTKLSCNFYLLYKKNFQFYASPLLHTFRTLTRTTNLV